MKIEAWSFSRFDLWRTCPKQFREKFLTKTIKEHKTPAMLRGTEIHEAAAAYLKRERDDLPKELARFATLFGQLRAIPDKVVENQWAFNREWKPAPWFGGRAPNVAWLRVILDAGVAYPDNTADVIDHKTGKRYGSNDDQMELFAIAAFAYWTWINDVTTRLWYLDSGDEELARFERKDYDALRAKWEKLVEPMFAETVFAPRPNEKCRFCSLAKSNHDGDPNKPRCQFG